MENFSSDNKELCGSHVKVWLSACRWAFAAGLTISFFITFHMQTSSNSPAFPIEPERINPNTAPLASMMRLPGIGRARASDIIKWRQSQPTPAFKSAASLDEVKGIGPKTIEQFREYLTFEGK